MPVSLTKSNVHSLIQHFFEQLLYVVLGNTKINQIWHFQIAHNQAGKQIHTLQ